ncbi:hypothetical protein [Leuconostoc gelidum]|uniref:hypothetical protein n=1 Tax=Leuconostoc gelidum TaxID=1244 RepID=UPI001CC38626|nr:hypothetical protein [Leuconostoc gelidum]MBZ6000944.1 hypothetical protein [Leuconostoc gelidum subsp. gelidum]
MKYGIRTHHRDTVPGYRDSWDTEEWFDTQNERDRRFDELNQPPSLDPIEQLIEQNSDGYWDEQEHYKINN